MVWGPSLPASLPPPCLGLDCWCSDGLAQCSRALSAGPPGPQEANYVVDKRGSTVNRVWERETGKSVTEPLRACVFRREPSLAQDPGFVSSAMKLPRMGGSFEEASRVLQGRSENTDSPGVSQTRLRTVRTEVWPSRCSAGRICKARMEGLPGFRSLSTAPCPPPASRLGCPSYPTLGRPLLSLCWLRSPSHVDTQEPPRAASWLPLLRP